jgi:hypothetical protein
MTAMKTVSQTVRSWGLTKGLMMDLTMVNCSGNCWVNYLD